MRGSKRNCASRSKCRKHCSQRNCPSASHRRTTPHGSLPRSRLAGTAYAETRLELEVGDLVVFCSDGVFEANDLLLREFGTARLLKVIEESRQRSAREIVDAIFDAVQEFRGEAVPNDDMTAVAV